MNPGSIVSVIEWTEDRIASLRPAEFDWIDFKASLWISGADWQDKFADLLSAFANGEGGCIVIGVSNPKPGAKTVELDGGVPVGLKGGVREYLENVARGLTIPPVSLNVHIVCGKNAGSQIKPNHALIVVEVPASKSPPHQSAKSFRYLVRIGSRLRELTHHEIMDRVFRRATPKIEVHFQIFSSREIATRVRVTLSNVGKVAVSRFKLVVRIPCRIGNCNFGLVEDADVARLSEIIRTTDGDWNLVTRTHRNLPGETLFASDYEVFMLRCATAQTSVMPAPQELRYTLSVEGTESVSETIPLSDIIVAE